jgi:hypothetical protein
MGKNFGSESTIYSYSRSVGTDSRRLFQGGVVEMGKMDNDCYIAHKYSSNHRAELEKDRICGCFDCLRIFSPSEIEEWVPETMDGECVTAVCPYCGDDSIIGESSGYPITKEFLKKMHDKWMKAI